MKTLTILTISFVLLTCTRSRDWNNPLDSDDDLKNVPNIVSTEYDLDNGIVITLDYAYSDSSSIILERKSAAAFETIRYLKLSQAVIVDTSFDSEINHTFTYRIRIEKGKYKTEYSKENTYDYNSSGLEIPQNVLLVSVELQGIRLEWKDKSNHEDGYKIEKDEGSGFFEIADIASDLEIYFDAISGQPSTPLNLVYRIKAYNASLESDWVTISTEYSGLGSPTNLNIANSNPFSLIIEWQDNSNIETGFSIERKKNTGAFFEIARVGLDTTLFFDSVPDIGTYHYRVRSIQNDIYSIYSNETYIEFNTLIPSDNLIGYWPFNGNANDESGNLLNGIVHEATLVADRFGTNDMAYRFDGNDDYIEVEHNAILEISGSHSFSLFLKREGSIGIFQRILTKNQITTGDQPGFIWALYDDNRINMFWEDNSNNDHNIRGNFTITDMNWHNITYVRDANTDRSSLYLDGVLDHSITDPNEIGNIVNHPLFIGGTSIGSISFNGRIDDVRIYNRALIEEEILAIYHENGWDQ